MRASVLLCLVVLAGCGQSGDLYLPAERPEPQATPAGPATAPATAPAPEPQEKKDKK